MAERAVDSTEVLSLSPCPVTNQPGDLGQVSSSLTSQLPDLLGGGGGRGGGRKAWKSLISKLPALENIKASINE